MLAQIKADSKDANSVEFEGNYYETAMQWITKHDIHLPASFGSQQIDSQQVTAHQRMNDAASDVEFQPYKVVSRSSAAVYLRNMICSPGALSSKGKRSIVKSECYKANNTDDTETNNTEKDSTDANQSTPQTDPPASDDAGYMEISAGNTHSCALKSDSTIICWGGNSHGQTDVPDGKYSSVAVGGRHSCGLRTDGSVVCWGRNWYGAK